VRIETGRRDAGRVEVVSGLAEGVVVVRSGVAFLSDGDHVRLAPATR
jgi:multidrug efflux pump subunit AcrA (membrane-fusion protein)